MEHPKTLDVEWVPIDEVHGNPANPRRNDAAVDHVAASLNRFGWRQPLVVKPDGEVIAGNTRLKAAHSLGMIEVPIVRFDGSNLDATAYAIADNRTAEFAEWDEPALAALLEELKVEDALDGVGFDEADIDQLLADIEAALPKDVNDSGTVEPYGTPTARTGDIWVLGNHRLMCGDSTSADDVARLMAGEKAALMATDPPYCVDYTGADRPRHSRNPGKDWSSKYNEVDIKDLGEFLDQVMCVTLPHLQPDAGIYVWHAHLKFRDVADAFERHEILVHQAIIWVKPSSTFTYSYYFWSHEPCLFGWRRGNKPPVYRNENPRPSTVWEVDWEGRAQLHGEHPTQKPVRLFEIPMEMHTKPGAVVFEPFSGSGSQIIAAEKLTRKCRAMEISPPFVDAAVRRWEKATGRDATLEADGKTFAETRDRRAAENPVEELL